MAGAKRGKRSKKKPSSEVRQLIRLYEYMADSSPIAFGVRIEEAPTGDGMLPWLTLAEFTPRQIVTYADLYQVFEEWESDITLEASIDPKRLAWIRIVYQRRDDDGDTVGKPDGYAATGADDWERVISDNAHEMDDGDADSLAARYSQTTIVSVQVYFGRR